jgi:hypothetical protein
MKSSNSKSHLSLSGCLYNEGRKKVRVFETLRQKEVEETNYRLKRRNRALHEMMSQNK